jgi:hypothetical protein
VKYRFLFILLVVLLFQFVAIDPQLYNGICVSLILLIGVPHGAADHRINSTLSGDKDTRGFILHYVLIAVGYAVWWLMMPAQAALVFYVMSMYHFGQEFLEELEIPKPSAVEIMIWGGGILLLPSLIAHHEIVASFQWLTEGSEVIHFHPYIRLSVMGLLPLLLLGSVYSLVDSGRMDRQKAIKAVVFISALFHSFPFPQCLSASVWLVAQAHQQLQAQVFFEGPVAVQLSLHRRTHAADLSAEGKGMVGTHHLFLHDHLDRDPSAFHPLRSVLQIAQSQGLNRHPICCSRRKTAFQNLLNA